jgi:hypothetical protein
MLGFGALGQFALGEGPVQIRGLSAGNEWPDIVKKTGLTVAVIATTFAGFVPPPPAQAAPVFAKFSQPLIPRINLPDEQPSALFEILAPSQSTPVFARFADPSPVRRILHGFTNAPQPAFVQPYIFGQFSQPAFQRSPLPDEQPSALFEILPPAPAPFTGFARFAEVIRTRITIADFKQWPIVYPLPDTRDIVFVDDRKKKRRKPAYDAAADELEIRRKRREAIEFAFHPPVEYSLPDLALPPRPAPPPNVDDLAKAILQAQQMAEQHKLAMDLQQDDDDLEQILKDIL